MYKNIRLSEYKLLFYRIGLAYIFYTVSRILFYFYNKELLQVDSFYDFIMLCYYGIAFDTTAILYVNLLFIALSIIPLWINTTKGFQKFMFYLYFSTNLVFYALNFIDFIYYKFSLSRTTIVALDVVKNEKLSPLIFSFFIDFWHVWILFVLISILWIYMYKKLKLNPILITKKVQYFGFSILFFIVIITLCVGGIRGGDFKKSTRPINMVDASRHVKKISQSDLVLNTTFAFLRTLFTSHFKKTNFPEVTDEIINREIQPIKQYGKNPETTPNVVIFILESYGKEYVGAFNKNSGILNYKSHTPFIDSLAQKSLIFTNAFANGRQSIHGVSSVLSGIPVYEDAFTSSPFAKQKIESLVSTLESVGYKTSFFHGAANGSMGFLGFVNILGVDKYFGRTEFNNDNEFDGYWGIWDEPFFQFMKNSLDKEKTPFLATIFTVSSHEPYIIPEKYKNKFKEGEIIMHKCIEYTDYSLKRFFDQAKKSPWFKNTIFVMVADHSNQIYYQEYAKPINRFAIPILFYSPNQKYVGEDNQLAQQIDIYPTILDMIGYKKPFRSWGRSLLNKQDKERFVINSRGTIHQFMKGNYICTFDGKQVIGFYDINDKALEKNLIKNRTPEMDSLEVQCKAFYQDYMNRIIDKKLN